MKSLLWVSGLLITLLACRQAPTREQVLRALIEQRLVPDMQDLSKQCGALTASLSALSARPSEPALQQARLSFRQALLAWERVYALRVGPIVDSSGLLRARFWPVREAALTALRTGDSPLTADAIEELGVDVRGMYALESLLFSAPASALTDPAAEPRTRKLAHLLAENVQRYADQANTQLGNGATLAGSFSGSAQESVSRLVNQMSATVETLASDRLAVVLEMHAHKNVRSSEVQGAPSRSSRELVLTQLRATERLYASPDGLGVSALVTPVAPQIDERVRARFVKARTLMERLDGPIEDVVQRDRARVEDAFRALKELEVALKVDLASALGVTLTFTAGDGD